MPWCREATLLRWQATLGGGGCLRQAGKWGVLLVAGRQQCCTAGGCLTLASCVAAAPEVCAGGAYHGRDADMWALGVSLFLFVYGELPFKVSSIGLHPLGPSVGESEPGKRL